MNWIADENGNKCSVEYFGSKELAIKALESLKNCSRCSNCFRCSNCSNCFRCSNCSNSSYCFRCSYCSDCFRCSYCLDCFRCSYCLDCFRCSRCSDCSDCSRCSDSVKSKSENIEEKVNIPVIPDIHQAIYKAITNSAHTTHCRAGWAVHLAGKEGYALEKRFDACLAAMMIYRESGSPINPARFFDSNEDSMEDIKKCAGVK